MATSDLPKPVGEAVAGEVKMSEEEVDCVAPAINISYG